AFLKDMGRRPSAVHSIERRNVNGDYCPENCFWATAEEQNNNRRHHVFVEYQGKRLTLAQLARKLQVSYKTIYRRLKILNWSLEDVISKPVKGKKNHEGNN